MIMVYIALVAVFCNTAFVQCCMGPGWYSLQIQADALTELAKQQSNNKNSRNKIDQSIELKPLYKPASKKSQKEEQKNPLLRTNVSAQSVKK